MNRLPVSASDIGNALTRFASVAQQSGATIEQAAALIAGGGGITQNFDEMSNALKISALRIRGKILSCLHTRKVCMRCYAI